MKFIDFLLSCCYKRIELPEKLVVKLDEGFYYCEDHSTWHSLSQSGKKGFTFLTEFFRVENENIELKTDRIIR